MSAETKILNLAADHKIEGIIHLFVLTFIGSTTAAFHT